MIAIIFYQIGNKNTNFYIKIIKRQTQTNTSQFRGCSKYFPEIVFFSCGCFWLVKKFEHWYLKVPKVYKQTNERISLKTLSERHQIIRKWLGKVK